MSSKPLPKKKLTNLLTSTDSSLSAKNVLGLGFLAGAAGFAFSEHDHSSGQDILDIIFPVAEGHASSLVNSATQGYHSSHASHTNSGSGSGSGSGSWSGSVATSGSGSGGYGNYSYSSGSSGSGSGSGW